MHPHSAIILATRQFTTQSLRLYRPPKSSFSSSVNRQPLYIKMKYFITLTKIWYSFWVLLLLRIMNLIKIRILAHVRAQNLTHLLYQRLRNKRRHLQYKYKNWWFRSDVNFSSFFCCHYRWASAFEPVGKQYRGSWTGP